MSLNQNVAALYKDFLRQTNKLPHLYLRQFWRIKGEDDVHAILNTQNQHVRDYKIKRMAKDLRKLVAANNRNTRAFTHVLDVAYGRKGKLKRELIEPILTDPTAPAPPRIIPAVESSRPPIYSKELRALLTSPASRTGNVLKDTALKYPPNLPPRVDPNSEEAWLLGPLSKRRETNARWRFFVQEAQKIRPPLEVRVDSVRDPAFSGANPDDVQRAGVRGLPLQGLGIVQDVESLAASQAEQRATYPKNVPPRWVRRRYRDLLDRLPFLTCKIYQHKATGYSVSSSPHRLSRQTHVEADVPDLQWLEEQDTPPSTKLDAVRDK